MSEEKDEKPDQPAEHSTPAETPTRKPWARTDSGALRPQAREAALVEIARLITSGEATGLKHLTELIGLSKPTVKAMVKQLGFIGGAGGARKSGGFLIRTGPPQETTREKRLRKKRENAEKREVQRAIAALKLPTATTDPTDEDPTDPDPEQVEDPDEPPRKPAPKARPAQKPPIPQLPGSGPKPGTFGSPARAPIDPNGPDLLAAFSIPASFDELERIRKIAAAPWVDVGKQLQALQFLIGLKGGKGKIDWTSVSVDQIPEEMRHRLAGMLVGWLDFAELPEVVRGAPAVCRQVYRLTGVLPQKAEEAEVVLERWGVIREELRALAGEVRATATAKADPLPLELAAEVGYVKPQWEIEGN